MSDDRNIPAKLPDNKLAKLHDNGLSAGSLIDQSLIHLNKQQAETLMAKAAEKALELEARKRQQDMDYEAGRRATQDHIDTYNMLDKNGRLTRQSVTSDIKTGAGNMRVESKSGATCFVASAAYGDQNHPDVMFLRAFRDDVLAKTSIGRSFITWYWRVGPRLARAVEKSEQLRNISKYLISKVVIGFKKAGVV